MSALTIMDSWYDIVKSYDDPMGRDPKKKKNDGTYSQSSVVILLLYFTFGGGHPYQITKFFNDQVYRPLDPNIKIPYNNNLRTAKVGTLLNKMQEDRLVVVRVEKGKTCNKKVYSINPEIIQYPIRDGTCTMLDGSIFKIPLDKVEQLLAWRDCKTEDSKAVCDRDEFFKIVVYPDEIDYFLFLEFLRIKAYHMEMEVKGIMGNQTSVSLEKLLEDYYRELKNHCNECDESSDNSQKIYFNPFTKSWKGIPSNKK